MKAGVRVGWESVVGCLITALRTDCCAIMPPTPAFNNKNSSPSKLSTVQTLIGNQKIFAMLFLPPYVE